MDTSFQTMTGRFRLDTTRRGLTVRDGLWFAVAVSLHGALFFLPVSDDQPLKSPAHSLAIELHLQTSVESPFVREQPDNLLPEPDVPEAFPERLPEPLPEPWPEAQSEIAVLDDVEATPEVEQPPPPNASLSTAVLLQSAAEQDWLAKTEKPERTLGTFVPRAMPDNWSSNIHLAPNRFDGMTAPREIEVLDRWVSSDGSQNVVLNTPTGETLCGRGLAWDPMQPLVEHVMQFRLCGGGGRRTFTMPDRYLKNAGALE